MGTGGEKEMLIEYMGKGFLENIISLFKTDATLFAHIPDMLADENMRVRLGTAALVEEFAASHRAELAGVVPDMIRLLGHENPTIRGDVAYVLGILKDRRAVGPLKERLQDANPAVRESMKDALDEIMAGSE
jgi:HEAT repeat protein